MTKKQCDLCGKQIDSKDYLSELYPEFQTEKVKEVCNECVEELRKAILHFDIFYKVQIRSTLIKRWMNWFTKKDSKNERGE